MADAIAFLKVQQSGGVRMAAVEEIAKTGTYHNPTETMEWDEVSRKARKRKAAIISSLSSGSGVAASALEMKEWILEWLNFVRPATRCSVVRQRWEASVPLPIRWHLLLPCLPNLGPLNSRVAPRKTLQLLESQRPLAETAPDEAANWISDLPQSNARDGAIGLLVKNMPDDPGTALAWAAGIGNGEMRIASLRSVLDDWSDYDFAAARTALTNLDLTAREKESLLVEIE